MFDCSKRLGEIAEISLLTNRWCMWADSSLPGHKTYVPAVFQTRDAFYHFVDLIATGIGTDEKPGLLQSDNIMDIGNFWINNPEMMDQLNEILHHISRGFFDVADHICIQLIRQKKRAGSSDCYMWYDKQLMEYSVSAQQLRKEKSRTPEKTMQTVRKWDILLQHITSAYILADENARSEKALISVHKLFKRIEAVHSAESIEKACPNYMELKQRFEAINEERNVIPRIIDLGKKVSILVEEDAPNINNDFINECERLKLEVEQVCAKRHDELSDIYTRLYEVNNTLFSITRVQKVKKRTEVFSQGVKSVGCMTLAAVPTYLIERYLFKENVSSAASNINIIEMLNDDIVRALLIYFVILIGVYLLFVLGNWVWWHIRTNLQFKMARANVRKSLPEWLNKRRQEEKMQNQK